jgi:uncharacterized integral membrane protein
LRPVTERLQFSVAGFGAFRREYQRDHDQSLSRNYRITAAQIATGFRAASGEDQIRSFPIFGGIHAGAHRRFKMRSVSMAVIIIFAIATIIFAVQNFQAVTVSLLNFRISAPHALLIAIIYLLEWSPVAVNGH